jgi:spore germination protein GerM
MAKATSTSSSLSSIIDRLIQGAMKKHLLEDNNLEMFREKIEEVAQFTQLTATEKTAIMRHGWQLLKAATIEAMTEFGKENGLE